MDIAAASMDLSLSSIQNQASISVLCKAKDYEQQAAANMLSTIQQVPKMAPGAIGSRMDILT